MSRRREAGFTLLEMIVVVAVLGLVAILLLARGPSRSAALDLRAASNEMAAFLRRARAEAIESDRDVSVTVSGNGRSYGIGDDRRQRPNADESDDRADNDEADDHPSGGDIDRSLPARVAVVPREDGRPLPPIIFHPDGSATGGRVVLGEGGRERTVTVDWLTGAVSAS